MANGESRITFIMAYSGYRLRRLRRLHRPHPHPHPPSPSAALAFSLCSAPLRETILQHS